MTSTYYDGKVFTCGGYKVDTGETNECFSLNPDLIFVPSEPLPDGRRWMRSSNIGGIWWLTGGNFGNTQQLASTFIFNGTNFERGPDLPFAKDNHCQVTINSTHVFFAGANPATFTYEWDTRTPTILEDPPTSFDEGACGLLNNPSIGPEVLWAEGVYSFIFSLTDLEWREGPQLPEPIVDLSYAQLEDGFIAAGGDTGSPDYDTVYKFSEETYEWELLNQRLSVPRRFMSAVAVPRDFFGC